MNSFKVLKSSFVSPKPMIIVILLFRFLEFLNFTSIGSPFILELPRDTFDLVLATSDGISSFTEDVVTDGLKTRRDIEIIEVANHLLSVKTTKGEFIKRRANRFLKTCSDWEHYDDLAIGAVHMDEESKVTYEPTFEEKK